MKINIVTEYGVYRHREVVRRLAAEGDNDAGRALELVHVHHPLQRQLLEVQPVLRESVCVSERACERERECVRESVCA